MTTTIWALIRRIDELFLCHPFLGSRRLAAMLSEDGSRVNRKRVRRLMRKMGIAALGPKPSAIRMPPGFDVIEKEGQPFWLFAAEEHLQCATTVCTTLHHDPRKSRTN